MKYRIRRAYQWDRALLMIDNGGILAGEILYQRLQLEGVIGGVYWWGLSQSVARVNRNRQWDFALSGVISQSMGLIVIGVGDRDLITIASEREEVIMSYKGKVLYIGVIFGGQDLYTAGLVSRQGWLWDARSIVGWADCGIGRLQDKADSIFIYNK